MIERLKHLLVESHPLPWRWFGHVGGNIMLGTSGHGRLYIMGAKRQGMQGAQFTFWRRKPDEHWGWNGDMETASEAAVREVPYRTDVVDIDNPNARLIVAAVNTLPALLAVADAAQALIDSGCWGHADHSPERCNAGRLAETLATLKEV